MTVRLHSAFRMPARLRPRFRLRPRHLSIILISSLLWAFTAPAPVPSDILATPDGSRNDSPALAFSPDGSLWLAWASYQDGRYRLAVAARRGGRWSSVLYPDASPTDQVDPQWAMTAAGRPGLVYSVFDGAGWTVRLSDLDPDSAAPPKRPQILGPGFRPTAAATPHARWLAWEDDGRIVIMQEGNPARPFRVLEPSDSAVSYSHPCLAAGSRGEVWLAFDAARRSRQSVRLLRLDAKEAKLLTADSGTGVNREPRISVDRDGRVWVVYEALEPPSDDGASTSSSPASSGPRYVLDRSYDVAFPSAGAVVTDGNRWWKPVPPADPAAGLRPSIHCASDGTVRVMSRSFAGNSLPGREFPPLYESLGPAGWTSHGPLGPEKRGTKDLLPLAESPDGEVWTAWVPNDRERVGMSATPSWTFLDGADAVAVSRLRRPAQTGSPRLTPLVRQGLPASEPAPLDSSPLPRYSTVYEGQALRVCFGDLHQHSEFSGCGRLNGSADQNQLYTRFVRGLDFMSTIDHAEHLNDRDWRALQLAAERNNRPGRFVTFTGFEWTSEFDAGGNLYRGHYNAVFREVGRGDTYFSASDPRTNTPLELWEALRRAVGGSGNVLTFPHHTSRRMAWLSWNYYDPDMVPLIEIAQSRGSFEYEGAFSQQVHLNDCARVSGHYVRDGLARGMRWGFAAGGDHGGRQLTAVFSTDLSRDAIFQNLKSRRAYATNGERLFLDVRVDGRFMGEEFVLRKPERTIEVDVKGTAPLIQVDLFRNGRVIKTANPNRDAFTATWTDSDPLVERENYYYLRAIQRDGGQAWSSPTWAINPAVPGTFRFQVGGDELHVVYPGRDTDFALLMHNGTELPVSGTVRLEVPPGWAVHESDGIAADCPPGAWREAVFTVTPPASGSRPLTLPRLVAVFDGSDGIVVRSPLFVVGSPGPVSREQKAVLIDARHDLGDASFLDFFEKLRKTWQEKTP